MFIYPVVGSDGSVTPFARNYKLHAHIASFGLRFNF